MEWISGLLVFLGTVALVGIIWAIWSGVSGARKASQMRDEVRNLADFDAADVYVSPFNQVGVAIDRNRREILLTDRDERRIFPVESIVSCEVLEDGAQLAYANRGSQLAGVVVGGALLGGVGAVIGGLSGSQRMMQRVQSVTLRFTTDDFDNPLYDIVVWKSPSEKGVGRDDLLYQQQLKVAQRWHARTMAMMKAVSR